MEYTLSPELSANLAKAAHQLGQELGFVVTPEQTILYLLRKYGIVVTLDRVDGAAEQLVRGGQWIDAIKLIRNEKGIGLKEAKTYVEERWEHLKPVRK